MVNEGRPVPNCVRYGFGQHVGFIELNADGTVEFYLGETDPLGHGVKMSNEHLSVLREVIKHLERGGFEE
jgi:hypothetical protein